MTLKEEIKKPFNIITLLIAIVGIGLSVFFYYDGKQIRDISYQINDPIAKIFDNKNSTSAIKLFEGNNIPITDNVYLLTGTIWNSGNLPIKKEDVRQTLSIKLNNCKRILDYKIIKSYDDSVAHFSLIKSSNNVLNIDWVYFDPKFGFSFQIMYTGIEDPRFHLNGKILDIGEFTETLPKDWAGKRKGETVCIAYLILIFFLLWLIKTVYRRKEPFFKIPIILLVIMVVVCVAVLVFLCVNLFILSTSPPF